MRLNIRKRARLYTIAASLAIMVAASQPAFAYVPGNIMNENSLLCLQPVPNAFQGPGDAGVQIAQEPCDDSTSTRDPQQWRAEIVGISGGQCIYYVKNQSDNKCLDVTNANTSDRAAIQSTTAMVAVARSGSSTNTPSVASSTSTTGLPSAWTSRTRPLALVTSGSTTARVPTSRSRSPKHSCPDRWGCT